MSAAEFYHPRPGVGSVNNNNLNDDWDRSDTHSPVSAVSPVPSPANKPLPSRPTFPPTHAGTGYDDDFFGRHHSTQSIETTYRPHSLEPSRAPSRASSYNVYDAYGKNPDLYKDSIPLHDTHPPAHPAPDMGSAEAGLGSSNGNKKKKKKGSFLRSSDRPRPWFCYIISVIQVSVFIAELARNAILTKTPIAIKPSFNPMIGPSTHVLINMGARFVPCMKTIEGITDNISTTYPCPNSTRADTSFEGCSLADWCGFNGADIPEQYGGTAPDSTQPNQWYRFIVPMFLHAGLVHIGFNMLFQLRLGTDMERDIGPLRFALVYFSAGIFGFVLGGNFAPNGQPSCGCSGSLFGIFALVFLDLIWTWKTRKSPGKDLGFLLLDVTFGFVIGLFPGLDNFSHIGGFLMGLILGLTVLHSPPSIRQKIGGDPPYTPMTPYTSSSPTPPAQAGFKSFFKSPTSFFKSRKPLWWAWWLVRAATLATALIVLIVLINNFYKYRKTCTWCKYLSCLPVLNWCDLGGLTVANDTSSNPARMLLARGVIDGMAMLGGVEFS